MAKERMKQIEELWHNLVESAFDFFEKAIIEHEESPKYAVLHLAASVELFLKSRLMTEHWTLILSKHSPPNFDSFLVGDFKTVTVHDAILKINGIVPSNQRIPYNQNKGKIPQNFPGNEFTNLANDRNKIAHFFHSELNSKEQREKIISQQCRVWHYVHHLLVNVWEDQYSPFKNRLSELRKKMHNQKKYLEEKFSIIESELGDAKGKGILYDCMVCEFESLVLSLPDGNFYHALCKVCDQRKYVLKIICPECDAEVLLECGDDSCIAYDHDKMGDCNHQFSAAELAEILGLSPYSFDDFSSQDLYCSYCEAPDVYISDDGRYVCLSCFESFDNIESCDRCNEYWARDEATEFSYYLGCGMCGHSGWADD